MVEDVEVLGLSPALKRMRSSSIPPEISEMNHTIDSGELGACSGLEPFHFDFPTFPEEVLRKTDSTVSHPSSIIIMNPSPPCIPDTGNQHSSTKSMVQRDWMDWYEDLLRYSDSAGHCNVPPTYTTPEGRKLGYWLTNQRRNKKNGTLRYDREAVLQALVDESKLRWDVERPPCGKYAGWDGWFQDLLEYLEAYGHCNVPVMHVTSSGRKLGQWLNNQKRLKRAMKLKPEREQLMNCFVRDGLFVW